MTTSEQVIPPSTTEPLLTTDNVGAVEANATEIEKVETEHFQEEVKNLTTNAEIPTSLEESSPTDEATLQSENIDITEHTNQ
jgi:hypothetical protein